MEVALLIDPSLDEIKALTILASRILMRQLKIKLSGVIFFGESEPKFLMPTNLLEFIGKLNKILHTNSPSSLEWEPTKKWLIDSWIRKKKQEKLIYKFIHIRKKTDSTLENDFWDKTSLIDYFKRIWKMKVVSIDKETKFFITPSSCDIKDSLKMLSRDSKYPLICYQTIPIELLKPENPTNFIWKLEKDFFIDRENLYEPIPEYWQDSKIPNYYPNRFDIIESFLQNYFRNKARPLSYKPLSARFTYTDLNRYKPLLLTASDPFIKEYVQALLSNDGDLIKSFTEIYIGYQKAFSDILFPECNERQRFENYYMLSNELQMSGVKSVPFAQHHSISVNPSMERPYLKPVISTENPQMVSSRVGKLNYQIKSLYSSFFSNFQ